MPNRPQQTVSNELVAWARVILIGTHEPTAYEKVKAYRILAPTDARSYLPRLAQALIAWSADHMLDAKPRARVALLQEALEAARDIPADEPVRAEALAGALTAYLSQEFDLDLRDELRKVVAAGDRGRLLAAAHEWALAGRGAEAALLRSELE